MCMRQEQSLIAKLHTNKHSHKLVKMIRLSLLRIKKDSKRKNLYRDRDRELSIGQVMSHLEDYQLIMTHLKDFLRYLESNIVDHLMSYLFQLLYH